MSKRPKKLLAIDTNAKTVKGQKKGYMTGILYLAPAKLSGYEVCPQRSKGCTAACLNTAGRGVFTTVQQARLNKTLWYFNDRPAFMAQLIKDIEGLVRKAGRAGFVPVIRLNGTSDIPWERIPAKGRTNIMNLFPDVQFYDYTKVTKRALAHARGELPKNYHLTFSLSENNDADALSVLRSGGSVAAVFGKMPRGVNSLGDWVIPAYGSYAIPVVDGDESDLRFLDPRGVIVGLKAKGKAKGDVSGFVR